MAKIQMFMVRRPNEKGELRPVSAWVDEYSAKFEADRWSYDFKETWDYIPATVIYAD
jgi:hypothetical protein